jgi:hypothetical protein
MSSKNRGANRTPAVGKRVNALTDVVGNLKLKYLGELTTAFETILRPRGLGGDV